MNSEPTTGRSAFRSPLGGLTLRSQIIALTVSMVVATAIAIFLYFPNRSYDQGVDQLTSTALSMTQLVAHSAVVPVEFEDQANVERIVEQARDTKPIESIVIWDRNGNVIAAHQPDAVSNLRGLASSGIPKTKVSSDMVRTGVQLRSNDQKVGSLVIAYSLERLRDRWQADLEATGWFAIALLLLGLLAAVLIGWRISNSVEAIASELVRQSSRIMAMVSQQAAGGRQQLSAVSEMAATITEISKTAERNADHASEVDESSKRSVHEGQQGRTVVANSVRGMELIKREVESIAGSVSALASHAEAIGTIIATVTELANQSHLLSLNAAIEASRAGEHGKGFRVVASEIKALAEQSKRATGEVRKRLQEIQDATSEAVGAISEGTKRTAEVVPIVQSAGETIEALVVTLEETSTRGVQIAASAGQQATGISQVQDAMVNIREVATQNLDVIKEAEESAKRLNQLSERLGLLIGRARAAA